jgi:hypothetical protein
MGVFDNDQVLATPEFRRICSLPRRTYTPEQMEKLATFYTERLKRESGTMKLKPSQGVALHEIAMTGGLFGPLGVGAGKTLITLLAPSVIPCLRPTLILPASLVEKTYRDIQTLTKHWHLRQDVMILTYQSLGLAKNSENLERRNPDLLILDEAHKARNHTAAVTRRITRYVSQNPQCKVIAVSGTMMKDSIKDFAHMLEWVLKDQTPFPRNTQELNLWADALDETVNPLKKAKPGALLGLVAAEKIEALGPQRAARVGVRNRILETPGVIATSSDSVDATLIIRAHPYHVSETTEKNFQTLRELWETPDGWALEHAPVAWAVARQLALGMHYILDPRPPQEWLNARRDWAAFVRETLKKSHHLDSELQVAQACDAGLLPNDELEAWRKIKPTFIPNLVDVWHDDSALIECEKWMGKHSGIVWVAHRFFGKELSKRTGIPYYSNMGIDEPTGKFVEDHPHNSPMILSIDANKEGRNLQNWTKNLITSCPSSVEIMEQLIGRTHRHGQKSDEVEVDILVGCVEHYNSFQNALMRAQPAQDIQGVSQKLLLATVDFPPISQVKHCGGKFRWLRSVLRETDQE